YNKSGTVVSTQELSSFFSPLGGVLSMSDPQVHYDELAGHWVVGVLDYDTTSNSRFDFAVSNDTDPTHGSTLARHDINDRVGSSFDFADCPRMGFNADAWVVSFNMYPNLNAGADHSDLLVVNKSTYAGSPATSGTRIVVPGGQAHFTMVPAIMHGAVAGGPMYFVDTTEGQGEISGGSSVEVVQMTNVLSGTPTFSGQTLGVSSYSIPPAATQKGTSETIATNAARILSAAWRNVGGQDHLVATQTVVTSSVAHARWYDFNTTAFSSTSVYQTGEINAGSGVNTYFPSIEVGPDGRTGVTYMESSANEYMSMY